MKPSGVRPHGAALQTLGARLIALAPLVWLDEHTASITLDTDSHAIPAMQEEAALIAGLVFAAE
jgi:hypothetical protein